MRDVTLLKLSLPQFTPEQEDRLELLIDDNLDSSIHQSYQREGVAFRRKPAQLSHVVKAVGTALLKLGEEMQQC